MKKLLSIFAVVVGLFAALPLFAQPGPAPAFPYDPFSGNASANLNFQSPYILQVNGSNVTGGGGSGNVTANSTLNFTLNGGATNITIGGNGTITPAYLPIVGSGTSTFWNYSSITGNYSWVSVPFIPTGANNTILITNGTGTQTFSQTIPGNLTFTGNNTFSNVTTFSAAAFGVNNTFTSANATNRFATQADVANYTVNVISNAGNLVFSQNGTSTPLQVDTTTGAVNTSGNAAYSFYGSAAYSSSYGAFKFETTGNNAINPLYVQSDGNYGFTTINFFTSKDITTNGTNGPLPNGVIGTMGVIGGDPNLNQYQPYEGRTFIVGEPAFVAPNFTLPTTGMGELWLGREGIPGLSGNTYSSYAGELLAQDGAHYWVDYQGNVSMRTSPTTATPVNVLNRYATGSSQWDYGANYLRVIGTNVYKDAGSGGGAAAGFIAISNSTNSVALGAYPSTYSGANIPPGGWLVGGDGNGLVETAGARIQISIGGVAGGNVVANFTSAGLIIGSNTTTSSANLTVAGTANITGVLTLSGGTLVTTSANLTNGAGSSAGTLTNAPSIGNPTKWIPINDNGTTRYIPAW